MDKFTEMVQSAVGGDPEESVEQTMKEKAVEEIIKDKIEGVAGEKVAESKVVDGIIEKVADAVADKVPASMLAAGALQSTENGEGMLEQAQSMGVGGLVQNALGGDSTLDNKDSDKDGAMDLLKQAQGFLGQ